MRENGKITLCSESITIIEFDDEIVMRFKKGANHEHKHEAGESSEEAEGNRQGNQKICKIKSGGKSPGSV